MQRAEEGSSTEGSESESVSHEYHGSPHGETASEDGDHSRGLEIGRAFAERTEENPRLWPQQFSLIAAGSDYVDIAPGTHAVPHERGAFTEGISTAVIPTSTSPIRAWQSSDLNAAQSSRDPKSMLRAGVHILSYFPDKGCFARCTLSVDEALRTFTLHPDPDGPPGPVEVVSIGFNSIVKVVSGEAAVKLCRGLEVEDGHINADTAIGLVKTSSKKKASTLRAPVTINDVALFLAAPMVKLADALNASLEEGRMMRQIERLGEVCTDESKTMMRLTVGNEREAVFSSSAAVYDVQITFADGRHVFTDLLIGIGDPATEKEIDKVRKENEMHPADAAELRATILEFTKLRAWAQESSRDIFDEFPWAQFEHETAHQDSMDDLESAEIEAVQDQLHRSKQGLEAHLRTNPKNHYWEASARAATHALLNLFVSEGELKRCRDLQERLEDIAEERAQLEAQQARRAALEETPPPPPNPTKSSPQLFNLDLLKAPRFNSADVFLLGGQASSADGASKEREETSGSRFPPPPLSHVQALTDRFTAATQEAPDSAGKEGLGRADGVPCMGVMGFRGKDCRSM